MATITDIRETLIDLISEEFQDPDPLFEEVISGKLHQHIGSDAAYAGVSPAEQDPMVSDVHVQETEVLVQFHMRYPATTPINPKLVVDPAEIEDVVERFQGVVKAHIGVDSTGSQWYYQITRIEYPDDPVGQKSRANVSVVVRGNNPAILETTP